MSIYNESEDMMEAREDGERAAERFGEKLKEIFTMSTPSPQHQQAAEELATDIEACWMGECKWYDGHAHISDRRHPTQTLPCQ